MGHVVQVYTAAISQIAVLQGHPLDETRHDRLDRVSPRGKRAMLLSLSNMFLSSVFLDGSAAGQVRGEPAAAVRSFHEALASGDRDAVLTLLDPGVVIFEQGGAEMSRDEYASHHLDGDIEFSRATRRKVIDQRSGGKEESAWVLTISETAGIFRGKDVSSRNVETMVLERTPSGWRIVHFHWSSHHKEGRKA